MTTTASPASAPSTGTTICVIRVFEFQTVATGTDCTQSRGTVSMCVFVRVGGGKEDGKEGPGLHMYEVAAAQWFYTMLQ